MSIRTILVDDEPLATQGLRLRLEAHDDDHPAAEQVRSRYEEQRAAYEDGYRGVLGMAYFCLVRQESAMDH